MSNPGYIFTLHENWLENYDAATPIDIDKVAFHILYNADIKILESDVITFWNVYKYQLIDMPTEYVNGELLKISEVAEHRKHFEFIEMLKSYYS